MLIAAISFLQRRTEKNDFLPIIADQIFDGIAKTDENRQRNISSAIFHRLKQHRKLRTKELREEDFKNVEIGINKLTNVLHLLTAKQVVLQSRPTFTFSSNTASQQALLPPLFSSS